MKLGLVLSGGGAKGAFQVGALSYLYANGFKPDVIVGTSVGAINGITLAEIGFKALIDFWRELKSAKDIQRNLWWKFLTGGGLYDFKPLRNKIEARLPKTMKGCPAYAATVDLDTGHIAYTNQYSVPREEYIDMVLGSSSLGFFHVPIQGRFVDGGHREALPIEFAVNALKCDKVLVIGTEPFPPVASKREKTGIASNGLRVVELMFNEIYRNDIAPWRLSEKVEFILPKEPLEIGGMQYEQRPILIAQALGYEAAKKWHYSIGSNKI